MLVISKTILFKSKVRLNTEHSKTGHQNNDDNVMVNRYTKCYLNAVAVKNIFIVH